jgi:UDP-N-acetylmuramoyl-L-alanyl-D-glutamate--2,6-diaminopimelate ligase
VEGIEKVKGVPGRLELVHEKDYSVYVDYAHTPDGLEKTLLALKTLCKGKLICVFGCGGNRDNQKRALMGEISGKLADFTVLTTDNPRFEEPMSIISEIEEGLVKRSKKYVIVQDRAQAIQYAIERAKQGDVILVSGKGNEKYQDVLGIKKPYNDNDTIMEILSREQK